MKKMIENKGKAKNQLPYKCYNRSEIKKNDLVLYLEKGPKEDERGWRRKEEGRGDKRRKEEGGVWEEGGKEEGIRREDGGRKRGNSIPCAFYSMNKHKNKRIKEKL